MQSKLIGLFLFLGVVTLTGAGCSFLNKSAITADQSTEMMEKEKVMTPEEKTMAETKEKEAMMEKQKMEEREKAAMMEKEKMAEKEKMMTAEEKAKEAMMTKDTAGMYKDYSPAALAEATKDGGKAVLFFWASWCPNCKTANAEFLANLNKLPNNVTILKTNYDTEKTLKTKYGVTYQHTFVQVDAQGNQITKWNGGGIAELTANLK